jgi:dihydroorotate dehydrogenase
MYQIIRPLLFKFDPELIHQITLHAIEWAGKLPPTYALVRAMFELNDPRLEVQAFGVKFRNPIGFAAGYDKDAIAVRGLSALGFGHVEVGTLTRQAQPGNPKPRVFRVVESQGLINSMGFPNAGAARMKVQRGEAKVGINIGKSKDTPLERAAEDYVALFKQVYAQADYVALNISSPNTLNLRQLQARDYIEALLKQVTAVRDAVASPASRRVPVLVKIAPDLNEGEVDDVLGAIELAGIDGIIATNTTIAREGIPERYRDLTGGLSGRPLTRRALEVVSSIHRKTGGRLPIIGVGGVMDAADALAMLQAGAALVQVYTGMIYSGPGLVKEINRALLRPSPSR